MGDEYSMKTTMTPRQVKDEIKNTLLTVIKKDGFTVDEIEIAMMAAAKRVDPTMTGPETEEIRGRFRMTGAVLVELNKSKGPDEVQKLFANMDAAFEEDMHAKGLDPDKPINEQRMPTGKGGKTGGDGAKPNATTIPYGIIGGAVAGFGAASALDVGNWTSFSGIAKKIAMIAGGVGLGIAIMDDYGARSAVVNSFSSDKGKGGART